MNARDYYLALQSTINDSPHVLRSEIEFDPIDVNECYIRGVLVLLGGLDLHIAEYIITEPVVRRPKYRYHLQTAEGKLISRWGNVPHHSQVSTFPDHRHDARGDVYPAVPMDIPTVLVAALRYLDGAR